MRLLNSSFSFLFFFAATINAWEAGRERHGLIGFSFYLYDPACAAACQGVFRKNPIFCTDKASLKGSGSGMHMAGGSHDGPELPTNYTLTPSADCLSASQDFLTSVAYCVHEKCAKFTAWKLEKWWQGYVVGNLASNPPPSLSYGAALAMVSTPPPYSCAKGVVMNGTCLADEKIWRARYVAISVNEDVEVQTEQFALAVFLTSIGLPIAFSLLRFLPFPASWASKFHGLFVYPLLLRPWRNSAVGLIVGDPPSRGQTLFIGYLFLINIILSSFTFKAYPEGWGFFWTNGYDQIMGNFANRVGVLSFANFGVLMLYSSRNNVLLWVTDWQHSTFILLHRWVGRIAILQAILHSIVFLRDWIVVNKLAADQVLPYWWWGCIGTIAASLLLPFSVPYFRQKFYEFFLISHIVLSILVLLGSWYHIYFKYAHQSGYEVWLYISFAIWGFDRVVRLLRTFRYGLRNASITVIDKEYIRLDIPGVVANGHVYLYFLQKRFWENHPFSVASSVIELEQQDLSPAAHKSLPAEESKNEIYESKSEPSEDQKTNFASEPGMVFFLRTLDGATRALRDKSKVRVAIEGAYGKIEDLSEYPSLICIAGGVGITACLPYLREHQGRTALYWSSRSENLAASLRPFIAGYKGEVVINQRLDLASILASQDGDFAVVVSGPSGMTDEVRKLASQHARNRRVRFVQESFSW